jgi:hypothetical protein
MGRVLASGHDEPSNAHVGIYHGRAAGAGADGGANLQQILDPSNGIDVQLCATCGILALLDFNRRIKTDRPAVPNARASTNRRHVTAHDRALYRP